MSNEQKYDHKFNQVKQYFTELATGIYEGFCESNGSFSPMDEVTALYDTGRVEGTPRLEVNVWFCSRGISSRGIPSKTKELPVGNFNDNIIDIATILTNLWEVADKCGDDIDYVFVSLYYGDKKIATAARSIRSTFKSEPPVLDEFKNPLQVISLNEYLTNGGPVHIQPNSKPDKLPEQEKVQEALQEVLQGRRTAKMGLKLIYDMLRPLSAAMCKAERIIEVMCNAEGAAKINIRDQLQCSFSLPRHAEARLPVHSFDNLAKSIQTYISNAKLPTTGELTCTLQILWNDDRLVRVFYDLVFDDGNVALSRPVGTLELDDAGQCVFVRNILRKAGYASADAVMDFSLRKEERKKLFAAVSRFSSPRAMLAGIDCDYYLGYLENDTELLFEGTENCVNVDVETIKYHFIGGSYGLSNYLKSATTEEAISRWMKHTEISLNTAICAQHTSEPHVLRIAYVCGEYTIMTADYYIMEREPMVPVMRIHHSDIRELDDITYNAYGM